MFFFIVVKNALIIFHKHDWKQHLWAHFLLTVGPTLPWEPASPGRPVRPYRWILNIRHFSGTHDCSARNQEKLETSRTKYPSGMWRLLHTSKPFLGCNEWSCITHSSSRESGLSWASWVSSTTFRTSSTRATTVTRGALRNTRRDELLWQKSASFMTMMASILGCSTHV